MESITMNELVDLCKAYDRNRITIQYETGQLLHYSNFSEDSLVIKRVKSIIEACKNQNEIIESRIGKAANLVL